MVTPSAASENGAGRKAPGQKWYVDIIHSGGMKVASLIHFTFFSDDLVNKSLLLSSTSQTPRDDDDHKMVTNYHDTDSETDSFHSFDDNEPSPPQPSTSTSHQPNGRRHDRPSTASSPPPPPKPEIERFPAEEEASLLAESNSLKGSANQLFGKGSFANAIQTYDRALSSCPNYLDYEIAVLRSNIAACYLKLHEWKDAVESAGKGVECLERLEPLPKLRKVKRKVDISGGGAQKLDEEGEEEGEADNGVEEVDDAVEERIENLQKSGRTLDEVRKLQVKLLMRRAKGRTEQGGWANLQSADEDYRILLSPSMLPLLSPTDRRQVVEKVRELGPKLNEAKEREMAEMMDKLKGLGNSILKPFGLSTENFKFVKDEKTGGYSMGFEQNLGGGAAKS